MLRVNHNLHFCHLTYHIYQFIVFAHGVLFSLSDPANHKSLSLRSEVLFRLKHYQSSLADADNAIKSRPTSYKVSKPQSVQFSIGSLADTTHTHTHSAKCCAGAKADGLKNIHTT